MNQDVTYISHKQNGDYELFCSECANELDLNYATIVGLDEVSNKDRDISVIEKGKCRFFKDGNWYEAYINKNSQYIE